MSFELPLDRKKQSCKDLVGSRLDSSAPPTANCAQQHHSMTCRLTNALAITVFDSDGAHQRLAPFVTHVAP